jgi:hypothetical protein
MVNAHLLDQLAEVTDGSSEYFAPKEELDAKVAVLYDRLSHPVLSGVQVSFGESGARQVLPSKVPVLFKGSEIMMVGRFKHGGKHTFTIAGTLAGQPVKYTCEADLPMGTGEVSAEFLQGASALLIVLVIYLSALWGWLNALDATALSFTTLVVANLGLIFANRSWPHTIWATLRTPNAALWWVIGGTTFFLGLALYVPFLRDIFHFSTLHFNDLALCLAGGVLSVLWFEALKMFKKKWWA